MDGAKRVRGRESARLFAVRGPHFEVQGDDGLFYASFLGRMDGAVEDYADEYERFAQAARDAVRRAGRPYVSLFDMRRFGPINANFARLAVQTFSEPVFAPEARALIVASGRAGPGQAQVMQLGTLGAVRVYSADAVDLAVEFLVARVPRAADALHDAVADTGRIVGSG